jgi:parallel beta-helix repeat protein
MTQGQEPSLHTRSVRGLLAVAILVGAVLVIPLASRPSETSTGDGLRAGAVPPAASPRTSGPIEVTTSDVTIDGVEIASTSPDGIGIAVHGVAGSPVRNVTIRNCRIRGFSTGIEVRHAENVTIENCTITDADYAGIALYSAVGGHVGNNTIQRIGTTRTNLDGDTLNNAYGITTDRFAPGSLTTDPRSSGILIDHNLVEDVPLWMGINTHAGADTTISNNIVRRTPRAIFVAGDGADNPPINVTISGNRVEHPVTKPGGTDNIEGILISHLEGGAITGNAVDRAYGPADGRDYQGVSTGITISDNRSIP